MPTCATRCVLAFHRPLQSNKTRAVAEHFDWVHAIDRLRIAERLSAQRPAAARCLQVCLQVNIGGEASKSGVTPAEVPALARAVAALPGLRLRGLMAIPEAVADPAAQRRHRRAGARCSTPCARTGLRSTPYRWACLPTWTPPCAEGATLVRIGTAIFGARGHAAAPATDAVETAPAATTPAAPIARLRNAGITSSQNTPAKDTHAQHPHLWLPWRRQYGRRPP
ncbi:YggS family pyridoxal phosphate enzyme [Cupriavidus basilensis]